MQSGEHEAETKLQLGDLVRFCGWYERIKKRNRSKYWKRIEVFMNNRPEWRNGLFLGYRTIFDGKTRFDMGEYDDGHYYFDSTGHKRAGLICYSERRNPVYVPLDLIEGISRPFLKDLELVKPLKDYRNARNK